MYIFLNTTKLKLKPEAIEELSLIEFRHFWGRISYDQVLSEPFIEKWSNKLNWMWISQFQNLSLEFSIKHQDKINLNIIKYNQKISKEVKDKFRELINDQEKQTRINYQQK